MAAARAHLEIVTLLEVGGQFLLQLAQLLLKLGQAPWIADHIQIWQEGAVAAMEALD